MERSHRCSILLHGFSQELRSIAPQVIIPGLYQDDTCVPLAFKGPWAPLVPWSLGQIQQGIDSGRWSKGWFSKYAYCVPPCWSKRVHQSISFFTLSSGLLIFCMSCLWKPNTPCICLVSHHGHNRPWHAARCLRQGGLVSHARDGWFGRCWGARIFFRWMKRGWLGNPWTKWRF